MIGELDTLVPEDLVVDEVGELWSGQADVLQELVAEADAGGSGEAGRSLDAMAVGARLACALEQLDPGSCAPDRLVEAAGAFRRQIAHLEAGFQRAVDQLTRTPPDPLAGLDAVPRSESQLAEAAVGALEMHLGWSRYRADRVVVQAQGLLADAPQTLAALADGVVAAHAAKVIGDTLALVEDPAKRRVVDAQVAD